MYAHLSVNHQSMNFGSLFRSSKSTLFVPCRADCLSVFACSQLLSGSQGSYETIGYSGMDLALAGELHVRGARLEWLIMSYYALWKLSLLHYLPAFFPFRLTC